MATRFRVPRAALTAATALALTLGACAGPLDHSVTACVLGGFFGDLVREGDSAVLRNAHWMSTAPRLGLRWPQGWTVRPTDGSELEVFDANGVSKVRTGTLVAIGAASGDPVGTPLIQDGAITVCPPVTAVSNATSLDEHNGGGFVAKDDVMDALGLQTEDELQAYVQAHDVTFTARYTWVLDNMVRFTDGTEVHAPHTITYTATLSDEAHVDASGAILSGWSIGRTVSQGADLVDTGDAGITAEIAKGELAGKQVAESRIGDGNFSRETWDDFHVDGHRLPNAP